MNSNNADRYPAIGQAWVFDIGVAQIRQFYAAGDSMHYTILTGPRAGAEESVEIAIVEIANHVFLVSWQEADLTTVVHVEDFNTKTFHSCVTEPNGSLHRIAGSMWPDGAR